MSATTTPRQFTLAEAFDYVDMAHEIEGEQRAEYGSGAVSLGYDGNEAMLHYEGYRTADDPDYAVALAMVNEASDFGVVKPFRLADTDDIPF